MENRECPTGQTEEGLGEIDAQIVGMQYYDAEVKPGAQVNLEREPDNTHDQWAIRVDNGRFEGVGHLPRRVVAWLAPLIDAGKLHVEGSVPERARRNGNMCPITLSMFVCAKGRHLLASTDVTGKLEALHEVVRRAYEDAQSYRDADLISGLADGLRPILKQELLPETRLLLALLPAVARKVRRDQAAAAAADFRELLKRLTIGPAADHHNLASKLRGTGSLGISPPAFSKRVLRTTVIATKECAGRPGDPRDARYDPRRSERRLARGGRVSGRRGRRVADSLADRRDRRG